MTSTMSKPGSGQKKLGPAGHDGEGSAGFDRQKGPSATGLSFPQCSSHKVSSLKGNVKVPGDKSMSHRALMLGALASGTTQIRGLLRSEDVMNTAEALQALGAEINWKDRRDFKAEQPVTKAGDPVRRKGTSAQDSLLEDRDEEVTGAWEVQAPERTDGTGFLLREPADILDMGNSGTSARLLTGIVAGYPILSILSGDSSLRKRPMNRVIKPLEKMGATFMACDGGRLPMAIKGRPELKPLTYETRVASAQVKSAVLFAGLRAAGRTTVIEEAPTRDHSENMLQAFGVEVETGQLEDGRYLAALSGFSVLRGCVLDIPADPSSAAFPAAAAAILPGSDVILRGVGINPRRAGFYECLREMRVDIDFLNSRLQGGETVADIRIKSTEMPTAIDVPVDRVPSMIDEFPVLAVVASCARGTTYMRGLAELRVKESDRLALMAKGLSSCGVRLEMGEDSLTIHGTGKPPRGGAFIQTAWDHRIAMSFLVLGMVSAEPVVIDDASPIDTSFPGFSALMCRLGADIRAAHSEAELAERRKTGTAQAKENKEITSGVLPDGDKSSLKKCVKKQYRPVHSSGKVIVAIDGPAASGKGTLSRGLARQFDYAYLDTGKLYRYVAYRLLKKGQDPHDEKKAVEEAAAVAGFFNEKDLLDPALKTNEVGSCASVIAAFPGVRKELMDLQQSFPATTAKDGIVVDGRDIGSVIFPEADIKFFVTAPLETRTKRRHAELKSAGTDVSYKNVMEDMKRRDERDRSRSTAPALQASDALLIDSGNLSVEEMIDLTARKIRDLLDG